MKVYLHGGGNKGPVACHTVFAAPASHLEGQAGLPKSFFDLSGKPKTFTIHFVNGTAEVDDSLGKYLVDYDIAKKDRYRQPEGIF